MLSRLRVISLGNRLRRLRKQGQVTMSIPNRNRVVETARIFSRSLRLQPLHQLVFHPPGSVMIRKVGHQALSLKVVFQAPKPTQLARSVVRTIQVQVLSIQITLRSILDLQFSSISGESSFFED
uniref:Uncharacterized protein n=1 Tax=Solanum tuberosum TaxID=4113 RepID=M1DY42_SOLTU